ncbi:MAG: DUF3300 domain-containing protein [Burkholderiales bacterium]
MQTRLVRWLFPFLALLIAAPAAVAQTAPATVYTQAQLDQMLAPIALYPDPLLSQILMAATYPLEVVQAARWADVHPGLQGDDAVRAVEGENWDPSVKSLVAFPRVLAMMDERLDWTQSLGEAFLEQEPYVMDTVQRLRERARASGNLASNDGMLVSQQAGTIAIEPANPQVVYVPYYDPLLVYGGWQWPAYPPVRWAPWPGYRVRPGISVGIFLGGGVRISSGFFFGAFDWREHRVNIVRQSFYYRPTTVIERRHVEELHRGAPVTWRYEPTHRRGIAYRNPDLNKRYPQHNRPARAQPQQRGRAQPAPVQRAAPPRTHAVPAQNEMHQRKPEARTAPPRGETRKAAPRREDQPQQGRGGRDN